MQCDVDDDDDDEKKKEKERVDRIHLKNAFLAAVDVLFCCSYWR